MVLAFNIGEHMMDTKPANTEETKKAWDTPELIVHGDVEKITKESPNTATGSVLTS
jgi:hypothetical protein